MPTRNKLSPIWNLGKIRMLFFLFLHPQFQGFTKYISKYYRRRWRKTRFFFISFVRSPDRFLMQKIRIRGRNTHITIYNKRKTFINNNVMTDTLKLSKYDQEYTGNSLLKRPSSPKWLRPAETIYNSCWAMMRDFFSAQAICVFNAELRYSILHITHDLWLRESITFWCRISCNWLGCESKKVKCWWADY